MSDKFEKFMSAIRREVNLIELSDQEIFIKEIVIPVWIGKELREDVNSFIYSDLSPHSRAILGYKAVTTSSLTDSFEIVVSNSFVVE